VGFSLEGEAITGLRVRTQTGKETSVEADEYVFCMGAIESARFFLQPRSCALPWNRSGLLGCHFQDHIDCNAATVVPHSRRALNDCFDGIFLNGYKYQPKIKLSPEIQRQKQTLNVAGTLAFESSKNEALNGIRSTAKKLLRGQPHHISRAEYIALAGNAPSLLQQTYRYAVQRRSYQPEDATINLRVHCEQEPSSASRIDLSHERDSLGLFRTRLHWEISSLELHSIRVFVETAKRSMATLANIVPVPGFEDDAELRAACEDSFHHMGGMRMHDSPQHGVVDTNLRLHGVSNAWVCSSAVFPTSGFSNPTHTLLALTSRLADHLTDTTLPDFETGRSSNGATPVAQFTGVS